MTTRLPKVGDVISSPAFAYGWYNYDEGKASKLINVDGETTSHVVSQSRTEDERLVHAAKTGKILPKYYDTDYGCFDKSRGAASFVVIFAAMDGGGTGMGPHDIYPDGWHIKAKRLTTKGAWDQKGETIEFYMSGCFITMVLPEQVKIIGHMAQSFA